MMNFLSCPSRQTHSFMRISFSFISSVVPNPKKLTIVSQYQTNTMDFSFLPKNYNIKFVEAHSIQSKEEFIQKLKEIEKDRIIINLVDNCEDSENATQEKYISTETVKILENLAKQEEQGKTYTPVVKEDNNTFYKISGITAIELYNKLDLAYTGASIKNFATKKTDLKVKGVPTPSHIVVKNRNLNDWQILYRGQSRVQANTVHNKKFPLNFPVLVKPFKDYGGSTFIQKKMKCSTMEELKERVASYPVPDLIVEEFIRGEEYNIFLYEKVSPNGASVDGMKKIANMLNEKQKILARKVSLKMGITEEQVLAKISSAAADFMQKLAIKQQNHTPCWTTDPLRVILPSNDDFQHEEMKWGIYNTVFRKIETGKAESVYETKHRMISQSLLTKKVSKSEAQLKRKRLIEVIKTLVSGTPDKKEECEQEIRDSFLHKAIQQTAIKAWRLMGHDGYFRYDLRVVESSHKPFNCSRISKFKLSDLKKMPFKNLERLLPQYSFKVYIIDANPYCSIYTIKDAQEEGDVMLVKTPGHSHYKFTKCNIDNAINREIYRRIKCYRSILKPENWKKLIKFVTE